ncbi:transposase (plasmid) [Streptomyces sp. HUAS TT11]|uniref:transposase n=1 Tax=Streptomyces sp. HUAS TT11 TaxID=3447508 RepID=UPI003F656BD2
MWNDELEELFLRTGHRFRRVEPRRRMRDYIRGLLGPVGRKNGWQLAEYAGHRTPDRLQRLLNGARWNADELRDDLQHYVAERLGEPDGILILDDTGFLKKGTTSAAGQICSSQAVQRGAPDPAVLHGAGRRKRRPIGGRRGWGLALPVGVTRACQARSRRSTVYRTPRTYTCTGHVSELSQSPRVVPHGHHSSLVNSIAR